MNSINFFTNSLQTTVNNITLKEDEWGSEDWRWFAQNMTQDILEDATCQQGGLKTLFSDIPNMSVRPSKTIEKIQEKCSKMLQRKFRGMFFKVIYNLIRVRITCGNVQDISDRIERIKAIILAKGGHICVHGESTANPYGFFRNMRGLYRHFTQYVFAYIPELKYPIEFQIGHPFSFHAADIKSELKDNPDCGKIDFQRDDRFFLDVKKYILDRANGQEPGSKESILEKAKAIHGGTIPPELQEILDNI